MCVVIFDPNAFLARYPEFSSTASPTQLTAFFNEAAAVYLDNTDNSWVADCGARAVLFNMLVAHIAKLSVGTNGAPASPVVGRIEQAQEGSVMVKTASTMVPGTAEWFTQTQYGFSFWQATAPFRSMRYIPGRSRAARGYGLPWLL